MRNFCILQLCRKSCLVHWYLSKSSSSRNFDELLFNRRSKLRVYWNATKNKLQTKFLKNVLKISEISRKSSVLEFLIWSHLLKKSLIKNLQVLCRIAALNSFLENSKVRCGSRGGPGELVNPYNLTSNIFIHVEVATRRSSTKYLFQTGAKQIKICLLNLRPQVSNFKTLNSFTVFFSKDFNHTISLILCRTAILKNTFLQNTFNGSFSSLIKFQWSIYTFFSYRNFAIAKS